MSHDFEQARTLFTSGVADFEAGRHEDAERKFLASLALLPGRSSTLTNLAATQNQLGRPEEAVRLTDEVLAASPSNVDAWRHRGEALHNLGHFDDALACYDRVLVAEPGNAAAWYHRAAALDALHRHDDALVALERMLAIDPSQAEPWLTHGQTLQRLDRMESALVSFDRALALDPGLAPAWTSRGSVLKDLGRLDEAAACFRNALERGGDSELNHYFLSSVQGAAMPAAAPKSYVKELFDDYAPGFDEHLLDVLNYRGHEFLIAHLKTLVRRQFKSALDLGCGTGLCGKLISDVVERIAGVDLSQGMLDRAAALGLYERLVCADVAEYVRGTDARHDLVVAGDVFIYIGDLDPVFAGVRKVLEPGGVFCFSTERADDDKDVELRTTMRFAHSEPYVRRLAAAHGLEIVDIQRRALREERQVMLDGLYAYLAAPG